MKAEAERCLHLLGSHRIASLQTVDAGQPGADPYTGRLTALGVVLMLMRPMLAGDAVMQRELLAAIAGRAERDHQHDA
jgi:hypothetical protein